MKKSEQQVEIKYFVATSILISTTDVLILVSKKIIIDEKLGLQFAQYRTISHSIDINISRILIKSFRNKPKTARHTEIK
jgi:hypothetical protein